MTTEESRLTNLETQIATLLKLQDQVTQQIETKLGALSLIAENKLSGLGSRIYALQTKVDEAIDSVLPIGGIVLHSAENDYPDRFLDCDGVMCEVKDYPKLFAAIGRSFTPSDVPKENFCVPDMRFRTPVCAGEHTSLDDDPRIDYFVKDQNRLTARKVGETFGTELMVHKWLEYATRKQKDDFDVYISRPRGEGADGNAITVPSRHWQPSIAMRFLIRAL